MISILISYLLLFSVVLENEAQHDEPSVSSEEDEPSISSEELFRKSRARLSDLVWEAFNDVKPVASNMCGVKFDTYCDVRRFKQSLDACGQVQFDTLLAQAFAKVVDVEFDSTFCAKYDILHSFQLSSDMYVHRPFSRSMALEALDVVAKREYEDRSQIAKDAFMMVIERYCPVDELSWFDPAIMLALRNRTVS